MGLVDRAFLSQFRLDLCNSLVFRDRSPVMSVLEIQPGTAFVKGGLFRKFGIDLPKPGLALWWRRHEAWETDIEGVKCVD